MNLDDATIRRLWKRHFHSNLTDSFRGDMAAAVESMLLDTECDSATCVTLRNCITSHMKYEQNIDYRGRQWFCERFGGAAAPKVVDHA